MAPSRRAAVPAALTANEEAARTAFFQQRYIGFTENDDKFEEGVAVANSPAPSVPQNTSRRLPRHPQRNTPISYPFKELTRTRIDGLELRAGQDVEYKNHISKQTEFLHIKHVIKHIETGKTTLRGLLCRRVSRLQGVVTTHANELVLFREIDEDDSRSKNYQSIAEVPLESLVRNRRIVFTTEAFPRHSFHEEIHLDEISRSYKACLKDIKANSSLVCRWAYTEKYRNAADRHSNRRCNESILRRVYQNETSEAPATDPSTGTATRQLSASNSIKSSHIASRKQSCSGIPIQAHHPTYGSGLAGAGGDVTGATMAGFKAMYAWDRNAAALRTLLLNHNDTDVYETEATDFPSKDNHIQCLCELPVPRFMYD